MKITILTVGKLKEKYWKQAIAEYEKRLGAYSKVEIIEVPDEKAPENMSDKEVEQVKEKEGQRLLAKVKQQSTVITLEIKGNMLTSEGLAKEIESRMTRGQSDFTFIIGGSNGLHKGVLDRSDYALSFSKMTFPHQMMRVILIEQVYRAFKIMRGEAYHK
ncbi:23S rRNA (pseudouridine(1915)-N(3))-methyltransferase RlmH [Staphylococcus saprophyticus]|uniref:23S rRNA (pseudouridine(1915)-N(3))-methyltransferase RlmH n=1 Tax=Staphylococcus saprophyticus TaxID=29385 RepID=UPI0029720FD1|nr:23S rRNA (pseudouridine(1915)-N(3))-methyltransferase RlmH [Staphylococcus saprophyticus]MDW4276111.1 23S rRNA (pseudouridine(1915)-N(3))-methyltransferase RlmH [Staphylococcus saprophyticus]MEB7677621.1 23S rRNA (pseudouridine(1915)-N(3))-methyltransferase RlmH [Staphylococcus saprophyticus]